MIDAGDAGTSNTVSGGTQHILVQGRDFRGVTFSTVQAAAAPVALAQLPAPVAGFTGREAELAQVTRLLDPTAGAGAVVVSAVAGLAGVGKTALAIQAAHAARSVGWFPGGVLFLDLHGYDETAVQPGQALDALLRALGVPAEHIPPDAEERAGLYRSRLAAIGEPVLVVVDNASAEVQVRPLLPGSGPHRVLVTSRHTLAGLADSSAAASWTSMSWRDLPQSRCWSGCCGPHDPAMTGSATILRRPGSWRKRAGSCR